MKPLGWAGFMGTESRQLINIAARAVATINAASLYSGSEMRILEDLTPATEHLCQDRGGCNSDSKSLRCRAVGLLPLQSRRRSRNQNTFRPLSPAVTGDLPRTGKEGFRTTTPFPGPYLRSGDGCWLVLETRTPRFLHTIRIARQCRCQAECCSGEEQCVRDVI